MGVAGGKQERDMQGNGGTRREGGVAPLFHVAKHTVDKKMPNLLRKLCEVKKIYFISVSKTFNELNIQIQTSQNYFKTTA